MCMVYRPKPARIITLNPAGWMLLELCNGDTADDIECAYRQAVAASGRTPAEGDAREGLSALLDHELVEVHRDF